MADDAEVTFITVDSAGRIGADFTGHISATGIDLPARPFAAPTTDNQIIWHRSDGSNAAIMEGGYWNKIGGFWQAFVVSSDSSGAGSITVNSKDTANGIDHSFVDASASESSIGGSSYRVIIDSLDRSHFIQDVEQIGIVTPNRRVLAKGNGTLTWGGVAGFTSGGLVVNHGLGVIPQAVILSGSFNGFQPMYCTYTGLTTTQFTIIGVTPLAASPANSTAPFNWVAIG